jgi:type I restriction enzyme R subunit
MNLGYKYLSPAEAMKERGGKNSEVILEKVLETWLRQNNRIIYKKKEYDFSPGSIRNAVRALKENIPEGLVRDNEKIYDLLCLGKSLEENMDGDRKSFSLKYIDWQQPENNVFHLVPEFEVARTRSDSTRRPDIVLFVNGIPFAVIENKRPDIKDPIAEAVSQNIRNQGEDEIPHLFRYVQIILALSKNEAKYGTVGTAAKFWSVWRKEEADRRIGALINRPLDAAQKKALFGDEFAYTRRYFDDLEQQGKRQITEQDRVIFALCRKERLLELSYRYIVFDGNIKKIARYQQYFTVKESLRRIQEFNTDGSRKGGVIWHTQGSGKSLTMVMLAKGISLEISNPRIIIVTDRKDLDQQIFGTFEHCDKHPVKARTGEHLMELISEDKEAVVTTVLDKFMAGMRRNTQSNRSENIFVLVDESHRSQYKNKHAVMKKALPLACYMGFTGTPLIKKDRNTVDKFGGFIFPYTVEDALADGVVVPLLYEGRLAEQTVDRKAIDRWFKRYTRTLSPEQQKDLKKKFSTSDQLNRAEQKIQEQSFDISMHFKGRLQGTVYKAQLTAPGKKEALRYKHYLDEFKMVSSEVLISGPDSREGNEEVDQVESDEVKIFWKKMMEQYGNEDKYNESLISRFKHGDQPEILIVVDKLLTGFDEPRNTVLYITRNLKEHTLLQAIARVNRICEGKDFGYILDYYGILGALDSALSTYSALAGYDERDLKGVLGNISEEIEKLPQRYSDLWDIFKEIKNRKDEEAYEMLLADEEIRLLFYQRLSLFARTLDTALSSERFISEEPEENIERYKKDLRFFMALRKSVRQRYAETVDFKEYEDRIRKLVDTHVTTDEVTQLNEAVNIFDKEAFAEEVEKIEGTAARADTIAHRTKKSISEKMEEDPAFYKKFSELLEKTIADYRNKRISESEYLQKAEDIMDKVRGRKNEGMPEQLKGKEAAKAFYNNVSEILKKSLKLPEEEIRECAAGIALETDRIVQERKVVDWLQNADVQNRMTDDMEDYLYATEDRLGITFETDDMDLMLEQCMEIAKRWYAE